MDTTRYHAAAFGLVRNAGLPADYIFDYQHSPIAILFDRFYNFCQDNLTYHCDEYDIQPALFFYKNDFRVNAGAGKLNHYYLIQMNMGTMVTMYDHFYNHNPAFLQDTYLSENYGKLFPQDAPPDFIMYQVAIQFTYYHELGHLIQKSPMLSSFITENYTYTVAPFSILQHLMEYDADLFAAQMIYFHVYEFWKKLPAQSQNSESLSKCISISLASIFAYLTFLEGGPSVLYFAENSHPHPLVRITYIMDVMIGVAEQNLTDTKINPGSVLQESFQISSRNAAVNKRPDPVERYSHIFKSAHDDIAAYIDTLIKESDKELFLVKNRRK